MFQSIQFVSELTTRFLSFLYRAECVLCALPSLESVVCQGCQNWEMVSSGCLKCGAPTPTPIEVCGRCRTENPLGPIRRLLSPLWYAGSARELLHFIKFHSRKELLSVFRSLCRIPDDVFPQDAVLIPIPLHFVGYLNRGFNQAEVLSDYLSLSTKRPILKDLQKVARTLPQSEMKALPDRRRNLVKAFSWNREIEVPEKIILVDDILTSGATLRACAKVMLKEGTKEVYAWTLCRTPLGRSFGSLHEPGTEASGLAR